MHFLKLHAVRNQVNLVGSFGSHQIGSETLTVAKTLHFASIFCVPPRLLGKLAILELFDLDSFGLSKSDSFVLLCLVCEV